MQASTAPADQPKVNTTASEFYVLQYSVSAFFFPLRLLNVPFCAQLEANAGLLL